MLKSNEILYAMAGIRTKFVEDTAAAMLYSGVKSRSTKKLGRTLLIAAVIAALLTVGAFAAGVFFPSQRKAEMPPDSMGNQRYALIPNGFKDSDTFNGSAEWWSYVTKIMDDGYLDRATLPLPWGMRSFTPSPISTPPIQRRWQISFLKFLKNTVSRYIKTALCFTETRNFTL